MKIAFNIIDTKAHKTIMTVTYFNNVRAILRAFNEKNPNRYTYAIIRMDNNGNVIKRSDWDD